MNFIILQDIPYRHPEGALAQYHGIIWAEELQRLGHEASKMVIGDPVSVKPDCPLLSVSTLEQRQNPAFWRDLNANCVLYYCGPNEKSLRTIKAVKDGSPHTKVIARIEGFGAPEQKPVWRTLQRIPERYIANRHCPTELFSYEKRPVIAAALRTATQTIRDLIRPKRELWGEIADAADAVTLFFPRLVEQAQSYFRNCGRNDLSAKVRWCGYPVRPVFQPKPNGIKKQSSVISIANWRHFKDPELTADAMAIVLKNNPLASYTIIGIQSDRVASRIIATVPEVASRVQAYEHIDNWKLPGFLASMQVFMMCSHKEGIPSVLSEALCCGCSLALAPSPACGAFKDYVANGDGTLAVSRRPRDVANAIQAELEMWNSNRRSADDIAKKWKATTVGELCKELIAFSIAP
ncbi:MAG: glycosyltransferase [Kiritimatiellia bacterium]